MEWIGIAFQFLVCKAGIGSDDQENSLRRAGIFGFA
jgi:hypothetical protein